ncbi:transmembrane channel-like protein 4 isoform X2 [Kryptolebias marmoratus]|uniref:transmembrane channel-like protein 4 isoform X2 n=1 Tax=Kryptolebias marmoratus TaxID=37003 RepID=UPI0018ACE77B|nr:transmembrane channel-like protein 4 isoform X2 [Kryptolebias marmoratus]
MIGELERQGLGNDFPGDQEPPRLRRAPSRASDRNYPRYDWSADPAEEEDGAGNAEAPPEIRTLPWPMERKRAVRQVQQMRAHVSFGAESWRRNKTKSLRKLQQNVREFLYFFSLWRKSLQKIGGNFGGGVKSYFVFLRFLVVLNFVSFLLIAGFVIAPSLVRRSAGTGGFVNSTDKESCLVYDPNPQGLVVFYEFFLHLLSGTGFMEDSFMFYGYYNNNTAVEDGSLSYNIPLAYLFTAAFYFAFCLCCIIARMGTAARVAVATGGRAIGNYSLIVFTGWDYGCLGDRATKLKQKNIYYRLQVDLEEERIKKRAASLTPWRKVALYTLRVLMFLIALGLIGTAFYGIFEATKFSQENGDRFGILGLFIEYLPSIVITTGNFLVPLLCDQIALLEKYSPSITVVVALLRAVVLRLVSLGILLFTLWSQITCSGDLEKEDCGNCSYNNKKYQCWETSVGQEMYKLTLFDLLVTIALLVLVEFPRRMVVDNWSSKLSQLVGRQEFVVPSNVLGLVYGQTVVWTGALFCPLLPLINTIKFVILFYCKKITLFCNCRPALKTFRSTTSTFFFLVVLLFGWGLALVAMIYSLAVIHPSYACGPFRFFTTMWAIVPNSFYSLSEVTQEFLFFIGSQAFSIPLFALSCVVMCYFIALASIYGRSVAMLKAQLKLEGQDKQFLVKQIEKMKRNNI